ncbi:uncharacterized protein LOC131643259 [Vicia villosa]|uniref:uncharacterized protein LOC131643259 n=1 Tax=Vicia villosa TaxID=3911 RepID=UPI00273C7BD2|nr:uncharacterized protein LOC131643259 [Vicia villosa]
MDPKQASGTPPPPPPPRPGMKKKNEHWVWRRKDKGETLDSKKQEVKETTNSEKERSSSQPPPHSSSPPPPPSPSHSNAPPQSSSQPPPQSSSQPPPQSSYPPPPQSSYEPPPPSHSNAPPLSSSPRPPLPPILLQREALLKKPAPSKEPSSPAPQGPTIDSIAPIRSPRPPQLSLWRRRQASRQQRTSPSSDSFPPPSSRQEPSQSMLQLWLSELPLPDPDIDQPPPSPKSSCDSTTSSPPSQPSSPSSSLSEPGSPSLAVPELPKSHLKLICCEPYRKLVMGYNFHSVHRRIHSTHVYCCEGYRRNRFRSSMAPFVRRAVGPEWFTLEFPATSPDHQAESLAIWEAFLTPRLFYHRLRPSKAVARKRKVKATPAQKDSEASKSNKPSGSDSITTDAKPTSSKPPMPSKRKVLPTTTPDVASDEEDKSPPRVRQGHKKIQKVTTPVGKGKGPGSSKITSSSYKVSSEESPLKATSNALVMESHNSSPATNTAKDDIGTTTSDFNSFNAAIDLGNLQDVPQHTSHILSPVLEDAPPLATINTVSSVEGSHSTDDSPPTRKDANMGEEDQFSGEDNAAVPSTGSEDTVSDQGVVEETSKLIETDLCGNSNFETLQSNILRQNNVNEQLATKMASHSSSWKAATEQEIKKLEEKIQEAESRQATIRQTNDQEIAEVARLGIQHFEAAQKLVPEIEELKKQRALLELRMSSWEAQYSKIKDSLPRDFS